MVPLSTVIYSSWTYFWSWSICTCIHTHTYAHIFTHTYIYKDCLDSIQPFWISREPEAWAWCNLAAKQRTPYCASMNSHSPVGLVSGQWDADDWACVLSDHCIHNDQASRSNTAPAHSTALVQAFIAKHYITQVCQALYSPDLAPWNFWLYPKLKSSLKGRRRVNATVTQYTSLVNCVSLPTD